MPVTVRLYAAARAAAGTREVECEAGNLAHVTRQLLELFPGLGQVLPRCSFLVDGVAVQQDFAGVIVDDDTQVDVLPPFAGG